MGKDKVKVYVQWTQDEFTKLNVAGYCDFFGVYRAWGFLWLSPLTTGRGIIECVAEIVHGAHESWSYFLQRRHEDLVGTYKKDIPRKELRELEKEFSEWKKEEIVSRLIGILALEGFYEICFPKESYQEKEDKTEWARREFGIKLKRK